MTSAADLMPLFQSCTNPHDVDKSYRRGIEMLQEAMRVTHARLVHERDNPTTGITRTRRDNSDVHDTAVKSWARLNGVVMPPSGRVTNALRDQYRAAHKFGENGWGPLVKVDDAETRSDDPGPTDDGLVQSANPSPPEQSEGPIVDDEDVRAWAVASGIEFQRVSKNLRAKYQEAHGEE